MISSRCAAVLGALVAFLASGCARPPTPLDLARDTTKAVYDGDPGRTAAHFDDRLRREVSPGSVSQLSGVMHRLGDLRDVTQIAEVERGRRYDFEALFSNGSMLVQMRLDPGGRSIAAYRVVPNRQ